MSDERNADNTTPEEQVIEIIDQRSGRSGLAAWAWPAAFIVLVLVAGFLGWSAIRLFKPNVQVSTLVTSALGEMRKESKLVVMSSEFEVSCRKVSDKRILWDTLNLGRTVVELRALENRVQYVIPTDMITEKSFRLDRISGELLVDLPDPVLDEEMVVVQSDPSKIEVRKDAGWARLKIRSGVFLEGILRQELRSYVIQEGNQRIRLEEARRCAEQIVSDILCKCMGEHKFVVRFRADIS